MTDQPLKPKPERQALADIAELSRRRDRAQQLRFSGHGDFLYQRVADELADRLQDVNRRFKKPVIIGTGGGVIGEALEPLIASPKQIELSPARAQAAGASLVSSLDPLPLEEASADLIVSALELHWADDPVGQLVQMRRALVPDGLMISVLFGGDTLAELRACLAEAEVAVTGGLSPRVAPMGDLRDLGALLQRAGFAMPVADLDRIRTSYRDATALMHDLRAMGETNVLAARHRKFLRREVLALTDHLYRSHFPAEGDRIQATFDIVFLTGWTPSSDQPQPLRPGSAKTRLADALGTAEHPTGETASPKKR